MHWLLASSLESTIKSSTRSGPVDDKQLNCEPQDSDERPPSLETTISDSMVPQNPARAPRQMDYFSVPEARVYDVLARTTKILLACTSYSNAAPRRTHALAALPRCELGFAREASANDKMLAEYSGAWHYYQPALYQRIETRIISRSRGWAFFVRLFYVCPTSPREGGRNDQAMMQCVITRHSTFLTIKLPVQQSA
ncbi:hypothetical protein BDQ12DRAFT_394404 [Crucibulum laeve]|uniref:Uncharacterized protein n=1 Tax=Crucibulum laeve TaxID=68775 RepID=A0A5C3MB89_9AGAR|nr:hypothetical protein BDQ12DRAFT_394404 [Crucibulum laeve]